MKIKLGEKRIFIEEVAIIVFFVCLFSITARKYLSNYITCYLFIIFHELSHMFVASIIGIKTMGIHIKLSGLCINLDNYIKKDRIKMLCVYLAGPLSNIFLVLLFKNIPFIYEINIALAIINLMPISPLDGFNILNLITSINVAKCVSKTIKIICFFIGVYILIKYNNISVILMLIYIILENSQALKRL